MTHDARLDPAAQRAGVAAWLVANLADAGIAADADGERLSIAGFPARFAPHAGETPADAYDRLVRTALKPVLLAVAKERLEATIMPLLREPDLQVIETPGGVRVLDAFGPVADISGSRARLLVRLSRETMARNGWRRQIAGNFLVVDACWHYATRCIRGIARMRLLEGHRRSEIVRTVDVGVSDSGLATMVAASQRLRTERTLAYGHPVRLLLPNGMRIRIDPVWRHRDELLLDFSVAAGTRRLSGSLVLSEPAPPDLVYYVLTPAQRSEAEVSSDEPIPVRVRVGHDDFLPTAWRLVVLGAAELLCVRYTARVAPTGKPPARGVADRGQHIDSEPGGPPVLAPPTLAGDGADAHGPDGARRRLVRRRASASSRVR